MPLRDSIWLQEKLEQCIQEIFPEKKALKNPKRLFLNSAIAFFLWIFAYLGFLYIPRVHSVIYGILSSAFLAYATFSVAVVIFHEASHRTYTHSTKVNLIILSISACILGYSGLIWQERHIRIHHVYTNVCSKDSDLDSSGLLRFSKNDPWRPWHRFQIFYALPLYSLLSLHWIYYTDFKELCVNYYNFKKNKQLIVWAESISVKAIHIIIFLIIPLHYFPSFLSLIPYYLFIFLMVGLMITLSAQLAHVTSSTDFFLDTMLKADDRFLHQLSVTNNFSVKNRLLTWNGGVNLHVIHHLFPHIPHVHYPLLQPVIKNFCEEHNIIYNQFSSIKQVMRAHFSHLRNLSKPTADQ